VPTGCYLRTKKHHDANSEALKRYYEDPEARKKTSEAQLKYYEDPEARKKCHFWRGGISYLEYPQEFNGGLKNHVRWRDHHECQLCGAPQNGTKHSVHHIDYDKKNLDPRNLITLCHPCHAKTNGNREYWECYFKEHGRWRLLPES